MDRAHSCSHKVFLESVCAVCDVGGHRRHRGLFHSLCTRDELVLCLLLPGARSFGLSLLSVLTERLLELGLFGSLIFS